MIHATTVHSQSSQRAQEYLEGWQRARAELNNFRKRLDQRDREAKQAMTRAIIQQLLAVADNFQALQAHLPKELADHPWVQGVGHVHRQLDQLLKEYGVTTFGKVGDAFTPKRHEAIAQLPHPRRQSGAVIEVVQSGYQMGDVIIRPAKVKVAL